MSSSTAGRAPRQSRAKSTSSGSNCRPRSAASARSSEASPSFPEPRGSRTSATSRSRSEEHTSELQSLMRISYAVFCLKKNKPTTNKNNNFQDTNNTQQTLQHDTIHKNLQDEYIIKR